MGLQRARRLAVLAAALYRAAHLGAAAAAVARPRGGAGADAALFVTVGAADPCEGQPGPGHQHDHGPGPSRGGRGGGADGYLRKDHALDELVEAVETVAAGDTAHSPELAFAWANDTGPARPRLAPRERQVLCDYASGLTLKATARRAGISVHTAKFYLDQVKEKYRKTGRPADRLIRRSNWPSEFVRTA
ncbi:LuxR C-terminal-related transcriptional regulator [Streptomyces sp. NPDC127106]|uniref:LuxR C-terminal-related transcriptional regulator n=1 Tax=Streptomyces sp. NPDC127106 TaxID=3345360 RepID=UPI003643F6B0